MRRGEEWLANLSSDDELLGHPFITGEVLMGSVRQRELVYARLTAVPQLDLEPQREVLAFVERYALFSRGIGYVDVNLLYSCDKSGCALLTRDRRLANVAEELRLRSPMYD